MTTATPIPASFADKLRDALDRAQIGPTQLVRRLGYVEESKAFDATRRSVHRHLAGDVVPRRAMRRRYETALGLEIRELEPDDRRRQSNGHDAHLGGERAVAETTGGYIDERGSDE